MDAAQTDPLAGLDAVRWSRLHHACSPAVDVPAQLQGLRSPDPQVRRDAAAQLWGNVYHQGTRWQASCHVVPFLVALTDDPRIPDRAQVASLLRAVALGDRGCDDLPFDPGRAFGADTIDDEQNRCCVA